MKIAIVVGMPASGKTRAIEVGEKLGVLAISTGDFIRDWKKKHGFGKTREEDIRASRFLNFEREDNVELFAKILLEKVESLQGFEENLILDGLRSPQSISLLRRNHQLNIVSVLASSKTRFERDIKRARFGKTTKKDFLKRDLSELEIGLDKIIASSDYVILNEETLEDLWFRAEQVFSKIFGFDSLFVWTRVTATEDPEKIKKALGNIFPTLSFHQGIHQIFGKGRPKDLFSQIIKKKVDPTFKRFFLEQIERKDKMVFYVPENTLYFALSKYAAYKGELSLVTDFEDTFYLLVPSKEAIFVELVSESPERLKSLVEGL